MDNKEYTQQEWYNLILLKSWIYLGYKIEFISPSQPFLWPLSLRVDFGSIGLEHLFENKETTVKL